MSDQDPLAEASPPSQGVDTGRWLPTAAAAARLGVKPATLYAYVSRGLIESHPAPDGRGSVFHRADVDHLAGRRRGGSRGADRDVVVHSRLTEIRDESLYYRGHDATGLALRHRFEDVAELLWIGRLPQHGDNASSNQATSWHASEAAVAVAVAAQEPLPASVSALDRLRLIAAATSTTDVLRSDLRPDAVRRVGRQLIATLVAALPPSDNVPSSRHGDESPTIAQRLWRKLSTRRADPALVAVLDHALVLLADHELAASTLAARVAASARCDPYAVIECGLAALGGSLHGAAAVAVEELLHGRDATVSLGRLTRQLRDQGPLPGFGHFAYPGGDPRARTLLTVLRDTGDTAAGMDAAEAVLTAARDHRLPPPTIDFALAAFTTSMGMPIGSTEAIFAIARCAGWIAHALEQYATGELIRPRAVYVGP